MAGGLRNSMWISESPNICTNYKIIYNQTQNLQYLITAIFTGAVQVIDSIQSTFVFGLFWLLHVLPVRPQLFLVISIRFCPICQLDL